MSWQASGKEAAGLAIPVQIATLNFSVDQYIAIGSPLGLFLALRKVQHTKQALWGIKHCRADLDHNQQSPCQAQTLINVQPRQCRIDPRAQKWSYSRHP